MTHRLTPLARALAGWTLASTALTAVPALAQEDRGQPQSTRQRFDLPPGELGRTLSAAASRAGVLLSFDPALTQGKTSPGLRGDYGVEDAFAALLAGSGLHVIVTADNTYTLSAAPAPTARREPPEPAEPTTLETILVTGARPDQGFKADTQESATKTPLSIRETPQSISVITRESMDARQARDLGSVLELSAGAGGNGQVGGPFAGLGRFAQQQTVLRGQILDSGRDVRIDGFAVESESLTDVALFERVEVVKGPSSVLYGPGSLSGFINRVSKKPQDERRASVVAQAGSFDTYRAEVDVTGALDSARRFAGRLVAVQENAGSFIDGVDSRRTLIAPSLSARLGEHTRVLLQGFVQDDRGTQSVGIPLILASDGELRAPNIPRSRYIGVPRGSRIELDQEQIAVQVNHDINDRWLASLFYQRGSAKRQSRIDNYGFGIDESGNANLYSSAGRGEGDYWAGELRLDGRFNLLGREHRLLFGLESRELDRSFGNEYAYLGVGNIYENDFDQIESMPLPPITPSSARRSATEAVFGQVIFSLSERTRLVAGLRHDRAEQRNRDDLDQPEPSDDRAEKSATTYRLALSQDLTKNLSGFAAYSESFVPVVARSRSGAVLDPETGEGLEVGLKGEWFEQRLSTSATVFRQERDEVPIADRLPDDMPGDNFSQSGGVQRTDGLELEMSGQPLPALTLGLAAAWLDSEFTEREDPNFGETTQGTVKRQTNLFAQYEVRQGSLRGLGMGATLISLGRRFATGDISQFAQGYERLDFNVSYTAIPRWNLSLQVRNVFDERYVESVTFAEYSNYFGAPRAALFRAEYRFDL